MEKWLNIKSNLEYIYFVLEWKFEVPKVTWKKLCPDKYNFKKKIFWRKYHKDIFIIGIFNDLEYPFEYEKELIYNDIPFLKSLLQKCIRRQKSLSAVKCMKHLLRVNIVEAVRRLGIIMVEDTEVMNTLPIIMWITAAVPQWRPPQRVIEWLLGVVHVLCNHKHNRIYKECDKKPYNILNTLKNKQIIYCLQFRKAFGGLKCDTNMLENASIYYMSNPVIKVRSVLIDYYTIENLTFQEWEFVCVDHHITNIADIIFKQFPQYSVDYIKKLLWQYRSCINTRHDKLLYNDSTNKKDFLLIQNRVDQFSYNILKFKFGEKNKSNK